MTGLSIDTAERPPLHHATPSSAARPAVSAAEPAVLTHLQRLEAESIHIIREVVAECDDPVMLFSMGKDSAVMLRLAEKAFSPLRCPSLCSMSTRPGSSRK